MGQNVLLIWFKKFCYEFDEERFWYIIMAIQHYKGHLGEFDYDDEMFALMKDEYGNDYLGYIGTETDGRKIKIPEGIKKCIYMFSFCNFSEYPPEIPDSVEDCSYMFWGCSSLKNAPVIPNGVVYCVSMFENCESLEKPPVIPASVKICDDMFCGCSKDVQQAGEWHILHKGAALIHYEGELGTFDYDSEQFKLDVDEFGREHLYYTGKLRMYDEIHIPEGINSCRDMFRDYKLLRIPPVIPDSVEDCSHMFYGCDLLEEVPVIPKGVKNCDSMFNYCSKAIQKAGQWNIEHRGKSYYEQQSNRKLPIRDKSIVREDADEDIINPDDMEEGFGE